MSKPATISLNHPRLPGFENAPWAQTLRQGDYTVHDLHFRSGETLPEVRLHYYVLGKPERDASGQGNQRGLDLPRYRRHRPGFSLRDLCRCYLFGPGQLLDAQHYFIILPMISATACPASRAGRGMRARFPHYDYDDMVAAEHAVGPAQKASV